MKTLGADYYDFLSPERKAGLAKEFVAGPQPAFDAVSPKASDLERKSIGAKRFSDKFLRNDRCPFGHYPDGYVDRPCIRDRLINEGYLPQ